MKPTYTGGGKAFKKALNMPLQRTPARFRTLTKTGAKAATQGEPLEMAEGTVWIRSDARLALAATEENGRALRCHIERPISLVGRPIELGAVPPCAVGKDASFSAQHTPKGLAKAANGFIHWSGCHKTFTFVKATFLLQGKGLDFKRFAGAKNTLRRCQSRPKHCLGETYADLFSPSFGCVVALSLLGLFLGASAKSPD